MAFKFGTQRSLGAGIGDVVGGAILKPQDVFATSLITGNGVNQTLVTGIDMLGRGGLFWGKQRTVDLGHYLTDTPRGAGKTLSTNNTNEEIARSDVISFNSNGVTLGSVFTNSNGASSVGWSFARAAKFFDIVTWTGDGTSNRQIPHGLGVVPGMIIVRQRDAVNNWPVTHRSLTVPNTSHLFLNVTNGENAGGTVFGGANASTFTVNPGNNPAGGQMVAYLFAHDPSADGIVQCGIFTGAGTITLGWQPQFLLVKRTDVADDWIVFDTARGWGAGNDPFLRPNLSAAEAGGGDFGAPTSTGFNITNVSGSNIYLAIRAPY